MISDREQRLLRVVHKLKERRTEEEIEVALDRLEVELERAAAARYRSGDVTTSGRREGRSVR